MARRIVFSDNIVQYPNRYTITDLGSSLYELQSSPGTVTSEGTAITASILNSISDEVIFKLKDTSTSTTAYTAALDGISSYYEGLTILFKPANTNTAAATININGVGAANIKKIDNSGNKVNLVVNDLIKNKYSTMTYDGTDFIMNNPSADLAQVITDIQTIESRLDTDETSINTLKNQAVRFATSTGSNNAYGVSLSDVTDYYTNLIINFIPNFDNTGACTLQVNSLTAKSIKFNGSDLSAGDLKTNKLYTLIYNGVNFELQPSANQIASHLADNTKHIAKDGTLQTGLNSEKINGKIATATPVTNEKIDLIGMINETFTNANNGKTSVANAIGSPSTATETFAQLASDINTQKNNLATNLTNKGQSASGTETLANLVGKVANINTGKRWAKGTARISTSGGRQYISIAGLAFQPSIVIVIVYDGSTNDIFTAYKASESFSIESYKNNPNIYSASGTSFPLTNYFGSKDYNTVFNSNGFLKLISSDIMYNASASVDWLAIE